MSVIFCLDTPRAWASYDFGHYFGIFMLRQRPYRVSDETLPIYCHGRECGIDRMARKEDDASRIAFLGNGEIQGCLEFDGIIRFWGTRVKSASNSSPRCAWSMKDG